MTKNWGKQQKGKILFYSVIYRIKTSYGTL